MLAVQEACGRLHQRARQRVRKLSADEQENANVRQFMSADIPDWFLPAAELTVACVEPAGPNGPPLEEPRHQDGGASVCHMGITLYGSRTLRCEQGTADMPTGPQGPTEQQRTPQQRFGLSRRPRPWLPAPGAPGAGPMRQLWPCPRASGAALRCIWGVRALPQVCQTSSLRTTPARSTWVASRALGIRSGCCPDRIGGPHKTCVPCVQGPMWV